MLLVSLALDGAFIAIHAPWYVRLLMFLPAAGCATGFLQMARNTCVLRAKEGTYEHDDGAMTPAPADDVRASRAVAKTIQRDALLIGLAAAALAAAPALL
jgi:hypothetical protein